MKEKIYVGKNLQEIEELAVTELGVAKDDLYFDVTSEEKEEVQVHVMVDANPVKKGKEYIEKYLQEADIYGFVERKMRDNVVEYDVNTDDANAVLIGHNAQTLSALHYLTTIVVNQYFDKEEESGLIVKVDVGNYRKNKDEQLEKLAVRLAREAIRTKMPVRLRFMTSYERKVIHNKLSSWRDVTTHSEGVEPRRYLIITPKAYKITEEETNEDK